MADYNKLLQVPRGTKARLEQIKLDLLANTIVYATDTKELGIKLSNGNIEYFMNATDINAKVDPNAMTYFNYAGNIYGAKYSLLASAWEHSLTVDPLEISATGTLGDSGRGKAQYPNGETEGVIIPQGVTNIGEGAFRDWTSNNQLLVIPNSVTSISSMAFYNWKANNQPLVIPNSVTSIDSWAFLAWTSNNQPLVIPNSVTSIGSSAFGSWSKVPYVEMKGTTPPSLANSDAFISQNNAPIYVPNDSVTAYKTATNWVLLANRIFPTNDKVDLMDDIEGLKLDVQTIEQSIDGLENNKVDKVQGKGLSTQDYTFYEKYKLSGIQEQAEVNVQSDWTQEVNTADDYIKNKPAIPTKISDLTNDSEYITGYTETDPIFTAWNKSTGISITKSQVTDLIEATQALSGLMSATDKQRLDVLHSLLEEDTENSVVDSINEVLAIFNNYPEGADLVTALAGKVDKVEGKGLTKNEFTDEYKNKVDNQLVIGDLETQAGRGDFAKIAYTHSQQPHAPSSAEANVNADWNASSGDAQILNKPSLSTVATSGSYVDLSNKPELQDKLVAGDNITIDNNVISASNDESIVDLGTFNDQTELITYVIMNQLPSGQYTFIMNGAPFLMPLKDNGTFYTGVFFDSEGNYISFNVLKNGEIVSMDTLELDKVNSTITSLANATDTALTNISQLMPISGGVLENYNEKITTLSTSSGAINLSLSSVFVQTPSANISYSITNAVSGQAHSFTLIVNMGSTVRTLTFPASVKWQGGEIPDMTTANKTYVLTFMTVDGGTTWLGMFGGEF